MRCRLRSSRYQSNIRITPLRRLHLIRLTAFATFSSRRRLFFVVRFSRNLASLHNDRNQLSLIPAPNYAPWHADRRSARACAARPKGKNEESPGRSLLQTERFKFFPATGVARATPSFIQSAFTSTTQPSLILSWAPRKNRSPDPSSPRYSASMCSSRSFPASSGPTIEYTSVNTVLSYCSPGPGGVGHRISCWEACILNACAAISSPV